MFRRPEAYPFVALLDCVARLPALALVGMLAAGCGTVSCPDAFVDAEGTCVKSESPPERCDGIDNDGDTAVDEDWPELGEPCGEGLGVGECVAGMFVCAEDEANVVCKGAVGPTAEVCDDKDNDCDGVPDNGPPEVCDGEDNDCDGFIDEGVLAVKKEEVFDGLRSVAAVDGGFAVTRVFGGQLRVETYDDAGSRTGHSDDITTTLDVAFLESDADGSDVYMTWGKLNYFAAEAHVDSDLIPVIIGSHQLHERWDQTTMFFAYRPPFHPRVVASSRRLMGFEDPFTFSFVAFGDDLTAVTEPPVVSPEFPIVGSYEAAGVWVVWRAAEGVRAAWLGNDARAVVDKDLGPGFNPSVTATGDGLAIAFLDFDDVFLSELDALTLECPEGGLCNARLPAEGLLGPADAPTDVAYHEGTDTWFVVAGRQIIAVGRDGTSAVVNQLDERSDLADAPNLVDIVVTGDTVAVMQSAPSGDSALTFLGCF
ncbi:MAG: MopE-related protein [Myxococcales bacterium]|nr:MopE-related protein [Myxococcales bacterium]MDH3844592.1 MopE-related protein [Myxococcales bacterium]